jgi:hypothetical protein
MQLRLDQFGYSPEKGFGDGTVPPAEPDSLQDLSSDRRVRLVAQMTTRLPANYAFMEAGREPDAVYQFPAWELVRIYPRQVPRGFKMTKNGLEAVPDDDWESRWVQAGGVLVDGRMIALKDDPIWSSLGDSSLFDDGTDSDAPPYWFGSGAGLAQIARAECIELGLITEDDEVEPSEEASLTAGIDEAENVFLADLKASRAELLDAIRKLRE